VSTNHTPQGNPSGALADAKRAVAIEPDWGKVRAISHQHLTLDLQSHLCLTPNLISSFDRYPNQHVDYIR